jgi:two-component system, OmpR family, phosphate regulon response regulator PhoB
VRGVRSVSYRFLDPQQFEQMIGAAGDTELELGLPPGEEVEDGEWVLAIFDVGPDRRATSAAARAIIAPDGPRLAFEPRDWMRLAEFAQVEVRRPASSSSPPDAPSHRGFEIECEPTLDTTSPPEDIARSWPPRSGKGSRILVVDDDADIRDVVSAMLEAVGLVVTTRESAEEALEAVQHEDFDLLVFDWHLPKMTGLDLCRLIRRELGITLPVLFLTANDSSQDMVDAFASGADDYVLKPFRAPELGARIFSLLRRARGNATS